MTIPALVLFSVTVALSIIVPVCRWWSSYRMDSVQCTCGIESIHEGDMADGEGGYSLGVVMGRMVGSWRKDMRRG